MSAWNEIQRTALYWIYDSDNRLLYIGMSWNPLLRFARRDETRWWTQVARIEIQWFATREEAHSAEILAIKTYRPLYNSPNQGKARPWVDCPPQPERPSAGSPRMGAWMRDFLPAHQEAQ